MYVAQLVNQIYTIGIKVPELNITTMDETPKYSGSGDGSMLQPDSNSTQMEVLPTVAAETPGQLYAYRVSLSEVILGTRRERVLGSSIGISQEGQGEYQCVATNLIINNTRSITVMVLGTVTLIYIKHECCKHFYAWSLQCICGASVSEKSKL